MSWILDQVPFWVWIAIGTGGMGALVVFVPGALAFIVGIWNMMPKPVKIAIGAIVGAVSLYLAGRNKGHADAAAEQEKRNAQGEAKRENINREVEQMDRPTVDKRLDPYYRD